MLVLFMSVWVCPNVKCSFDKELQSGGKCPICGEAAKEFPLSETSNLLKQKWEYKKSVEKARREEKLAGKMKFCPKCGSSNLNVQVFYRPSIWKCLNCGYEGAFILEDSKLAEKLQHQKRNNDKKKS
jgi:ribosomal protein L37AE/L43A